MSAANERPAPPLAPKGGEGERQNELPVDFYKALMQTPACQRGQPCDNCGRCQH